MIKPTYSQGWNIALYQFLGRRAGHIVQAVMGHEQASTTLNRYTHTPDGYDQRVLAAFEASSD